MPQTPQPRPAHPKLCPPQRSRVDFARTDLDDARAADLAAMSAASLILLVERLRGRLDDVLHLIDETHE